MKFIHTADLHIDSKIDYLPSSLSLVRREEILQSFERLCDYAKTNNVTAIIISGDLFDSTKITKKTIERVKNSITLADSVDFLYLAGNHDENVLDQVFSSFPHNFKQFEKDFSSFRYGNVVVSGLTYNKSILSSLYDTINLNKNDFNILAMHGEVVDYKGKTKDGVISLPMLKDKNIDYLALGHYHSFLTKKLDERGSLAYSGCLDGRGFDELNQKGFVLIDTDVSTNNAISFIPFSSREYIEYSFDISTFDNWVKARKEILETLQNELDGKNLLKLIIKGEHSQNFEIDKKELETRLSEIFFYAKIEDKTQLKISQDDYMLDKTVRGEFLRLVWESDLTDDQKKKVISCGLNALKGEDIL